MKLDTEADSPNKTLLLKNQEEDVKTKVIRCNHLY